MRTQTAQNYKSMTYAQLDAIEREIASEKNRRYEAACNVGKELASKAAFATKITSFLDTLQTAKTQTGVVAKPAKVNGRKRTNKPNVAAKYRNPETGETWSGRGRPARWLQAHLDKGAKREQYLAV